MPKRIQRKRTKGARHDGAVIVSRPSRFGNPCKVALMQEMGYEDPHAAAAYNFRTWLGGDRSDAPTDEADWRRERILTDLPLMLRGKNVACTCRPDQTCHGDELLRLATLSPAEYDTWAARVRARVARNREWRGEKPLTSAPVTPVTSGGGRRG